MEATYEFSGVTATGYGYQGANCLHVVPSFPVGKRKPSPPPGKCGRKNWAGKPCHLVGKKNGFRISNKEVGICKLLANT